MKQNTADVKHGTEKSRKRAPSSGLWPCMKGALKETLQSFFSVSDEQAMWRVQMQDDEAAFAQLVRRWERPIQRLCIRMLADPCRGQDLAQETFVRGFSKRRPF